MPELPEAEVVRRGLEEWVAGRHVLSATVHDPRSLRRQAGGPDEFVAAVQGARLAAAVRRGKFLWMPLEGQGLSLVAHLGMSGQLLVQDADHPEPRHLKATLRLSPSAGSPDELRFVDQRIFGGLHTSRLVATGDGGPGGTGSEEPLLPVAAAHIARDVLDPAVTARGLHALIRSRRSGIKRAILDQRLLSGVGNIYADEALFDARIHYERPCSSMRPGLTARLLESLREVMLRALDQGGTSFDSLYVNVNGSSGYFERSLKVYGREGRPCPRCGALIEREAFMNRSSHFCPRCQRGPRH
ncbi:bifunctional DNA-formamidopyrimidine glycosylase/DNA-(apurinic or apyrimidinic site) lyase [Zafaria sp. J156]|uniref:bifunctional DNA-formamidopyrimidine glycosylase/DNA-(apurinic or apyrimidinic site) lyase n=1 Tax=Zafaria sp. J156 TaxID=3116490 RepID=UPI002E75B5F6|nr:bifunctional DNA-formamidopyrimidine glycosylase/DNA-(apurinic or apyrimidinic site) lyase [Zafaria sp. J156]MEE1620727.1 bifunctional DNA-formamidopyrimidine glycosylase/DNA-(apurinic or apyrimidinic site) lyase [Zafaria sp. J156]